MANTNIGGQVASIKVSKLVALWGDDVAVKRSKREGAKYPLYLSTSTGPVHLNTVNGQDFLLEYGVFHGANDPAPETIPAPIPETVAPTPETIPAPIPKKTHGENSFLGFLRSDGDLGI